MRWINSNVEALLKLEKGITLKDSTENIRRLIKAHGPINVGRYMVEALSHPQYGYYSRQDPFGRSGDFTTAPEITQIFGELIGLWAITIWQAMGAPSSFTLVETGPGRGTLMIDALRACKLNPAFIAAAQITLIENSRKLRQQQKMALSDYKITWCDHIFQLPKTPTILISNEFFDTLPIRQLEKTDNGWRERLIGVTDDSFCFVLDKNKIPGQDLTISSSDANIGDIIEISPTRNNIAAEIGLLLAKHVGAALIIDYGSIKTKLGDTLQAVHNHERCDVLKMPGTVDLSSHVDFESISRAARNSGCDVYGPMPQGEFLQRLGIQQRAESLKLSASNSQAMDIDSGVIRLTDNTQMGTLFKVISITNPLMSPPLGFDPA